MMALLRLLPFLHWIISYTNSSCLEHRKEEKSRVEMHGKANLYIERYLYKLVKQGALYCSKEVVGARAFVFPWL